MVPGNKSALIAEDDALLARALQAKLALVWPRLQISVCVGDGTSAVETALQIQPDILF